MLSEVLRKFSLKILCLWIFQGSACCQYSREHRQFDTLSFELFRWIAQEGVQRNPWQSIRFTNNCLVKTRITQNLLETVLKFAMVKTHLP